ncbi:MAG TPA: hypothetical protein PKI03_35080 [Pseudomonadota bacterium]|nr:hypothetical protein [Pseudomonadota bacterium]
MSWQALGKQRYRVEHDVVYWETEGEVSAQEVHAITDVIVGVHRQHGSAYVICDSTRSTNFSPEARLAMRHRYEAGTAVQAPSVVIGGSSFQRVLLTLVVRAIRLLGKQPPPIEFVPTMNAAERWVQRQRELRAHHQANESQP